MRCLNKRPELFSRAGLVGEHEVCAHAAVVAAHAQSRRAPAALALASCALAATAFTAADARRPGAPICVPDLWHWIRKGEGAAVTFKSELYLTCNRFIDTFQLAEFNFTYATDPVWLFICFPFQIWFAKTVLCETNLTYIFR